MNVDVSIKISNSLNVNSKIKVLNSLKVESEVKIPQVIGEGRDVTEETDNYELLNDELEAVIDSLPDANNSGDSQLTQSKNVEFTENGEYIVKPDAGFVLEEVNVKVDVPIPIMIEENWILELVDGTTINKTVYVRSDDELE